MDGHTHPLLLLAFEAPLITVMAELGLLAGHPPLPLEDAMPSDVPDASAHKSPTPATRCCNGGGRTCGKTLSGAAAGGGGPMEGSDTGGSGMPAAACCKVYAYFIMYCLGLYSALSEAGVSGLSEPSSGITGFDRSGQESGYEPVP